MKRLVLITLTATLFPAFHQALSVKVLQAQGAVPADVQKAIERLKSPLAVERVAVAIQLGQMGSRAAAAVPFLIELFEDTELVTMKVSIGESPSVVLESRTSTRNQAVVALGKIGEPAVEPLVAAIEDPDHRVSAFNALGKIGEPAVDELSRLLGTGEHTRLVVVALGATGNVGAVAPLISALTDMDDEVRERAVKALGGIGDTGAVEALISTLQNDQNQQVQWEAAEALGAVGDPRAIEPLIAAMGEGVLRTHRALERLTGVEHLGSDDHEGWVKWWELNKARFRRP